MNFIKVMVMKNRDWLEFCWGVDGYEKANFKI